MSEEKQLAGQIAVVTGAARGIGAAIARRLAEMGAEVYLTARDTQLLGQVADEICAEGGRAIVAPCDLLSEAAIAELAAQVTKDAGRCDILVNNAGVAANGKPLHELLPAEWDRVINVNLKAPYLMIRAFAPMMIAAGRGHIVNISSLAGRNPLPNATVYATSKSALNGLTYSVAEELRAYGIRVSVVAPGSVNTSFGRSAGHPSADAEKAAWQIQPEDVADVVAMLATQAPQSFVSEVLMRPTRKP